MFKKLPNALTISRMAIIPVIIISFYIPGKLANIIVAGLFLAASITDYFDGYLARLMKAQSNFGKCLDPIADKLLVAVAIIMLIHFGERNLFITIPGVIIICRELLVSGLREYLAGLNVSVPVTRLAKWKTGIQMTAITLLLLGEKGSEYALTEILSSDPETIKYIAGSITTTIGEILFAIAAVITMITGYIYLKAGCKNM